MLQGLLEAAGGVGLFLLGMVVLTDGLRALAGGALRRFLARSTRSPLSGVASGTVATAIIQSSSATTVSAVGFVAAGLLTFPQALGVVFGANIGTTLTGWLVALLGFKLKLSLIAPAIVLVGALLRLFARGRSASVGLAIAGFGLVFVGIGLMQSGMSVLEGTVTPASFPPDTWLGRVLLVGIGGLVTLVTQSSSSGVAMALAAVAGGTLSVTQAAAMVIGMDVATTATSAIAAVGASLPARRTAYAHVIYNVFTGVAAYLLLTPYFAILAWILPGASQTHPELVLVGFHTTFNTLGVIAVLPVVGSFARVVERVVSGRGDPFTRRLDASLTRHPEGALDALLGALRELAAAVFAEVAARLHGRGEVLGQRGREELLGSLDEARDYALRIAASAEGSPTSGRREHGMHAIDHLVRAVRRCDRPGAAAPAPLEPERKAQREELAGAFDAGVHWAAGYGPNPESRLHALRDALEAFGPEFRRRVLSRSAAGNGDPDELLSQLDAIRWERRMAHHAWRIVHHLQQMAALTRSTGPPPAEPDVD